MWNSKLVASTSGFLAFLKETAVSTFVSSKLVDLASKLGGYHAALDIAKGDKRLTELAM